MAANSIPPKKQLGPQPWLTSSATQKVLDALQAKGATVRFVGGCVRNALLAEPVNDIDIATPDEPENVIALLEDAGVKAIPTGIEHGTITAVWENETFEITTLRKDVETDGRRASVAFTTEWEEDAKRRDFTINAIYADAGGALFDPVGGLDDLAVRQVRFIGEPEERIKEDYLRILRFFRIHAWYGEGDLYEEGLSAVSGLKAGLSQLSAERVQVEILKLLGAASPLPVLRKMAAVGVLPIILPEAKQFDRFERLADIEGNQLFVSDPLRRLGALVDLDEEESLALAGRIRLSNVDKKRLVEMQTVDAKIVSYLSIRELRKLLYRLGNTTFSDLMMLRWAEDQKASNGVQWRAMLAMADSWVRPEFPLEGREVMAAGVPEGPEVGRVMQEVEEWWIDSDFTDDRFSIIERLKAVVQATIL
jgi:poly(A) polymerase